MAPRRNAGPGPGGLPSPLPADSEKTASVRAMFDTIAPRYDLVNRLMTFGLDQRWRRATVDALALPRGARVLDLACGTGDLSRAATGRGLTVVGTDLSAGMLAANRTHAPLVESDAGHLAFADGAFDGLVCGYALRNFTDLAATLTEAARVLRPGGRLAALEVDAPSSGLWRFGFDLWFNKVVPLIGGALSDRAAYRYLPASVAYLPPTPVLRRMLIDGGFSAVGIRPLAGGLSQLIVATRIGTPPAPP
ncbi:MAG TPA: ubiquinone/menaquinone biosynthesis methyltransferase [Acidimicrobiales bacterium]|jgi:demethylmenaquinone methyltransferase/2-methoxy-6-polyprenyl-1,4-benzoquinol methylase|nr:ubiquinone/menaquinone biosynthesis methyltransferase [Acidimicrobiales bacterium]